MRDSVKINIGGLEYKFRGDNQEELMEAAAVLNDQIEVIRKIYKNELPQADLHLLAAMNVADNIIKINTQVANDQKLLISDMNKMIEILEIALND